MAESLDEVKALARIYYESADKNSQSNEALAERHRAFARALEGVAQELEDLRVRTRPIPADYGDLSDLPPEVMAELSLTKADLLEQQIHNIIAAGAGREVDLDTVIIELWRRHRVHHSRRFLMNKLYRMASKTLIIGVEGRKGAYVVANASNTKPQASRTRPSFDDDLDDEPEQDEEDADVPF
jgi:hypothetical protein